VSFIYRIKEFIVHDLYNGCRAIRVSGTSNPL